VDLSVRTERRRLHEAGSRGRKPRKKPLLSKKNIAKRLKWAKERINWTSKDWGRVLWSDESKFCIFGGINCAFVWKKRLEALKPKNVVHTVKHGGGK